MIIDGEFVNEIIDKNLAEFAQKNVSSVQRKFPETQDPWRNPFQRDRDRIIHTTAFRRLRGKMQVVPPSLGDHFRNRLSHTIEVSQIARDIARQLKINEDLVESIALAHDLGHPPFGHSGEKSLNEKMQQFGKSFEHNQQSLRVVDFFEIRYPDFTGLNLTQEVREGMQKHNSFFVREKSGNSPIFTPHLESQTVDISDSIAYLSADLEDGIRGEFFNFSDLKNLQIYKILENNLSPKELNFRHSFIRGVMRVFISELIKNSRKNLTKFSIKTLPDVQNQKNKIIAFSSEFKKIYEELKDFLFTNFYHHEDVLIATKKGEKIIKETFDFLLKNDKTFISKGEDDLETRICDFIAGMTDEFAEKFYFDNVKS